FNVRSAPILMNVVFSGNASTEAGTGDFLGAHGGGGLYNLLGNSNGGPYLTNLVVAGNTAVDGGGGIRNASVDPRLFNSILWGNRTDGEGAQMLNGGVSGSAPVVANSLFEGGLPEGSQNGGAILDADPLFADAAGPDGTSGTDDDDLRLLAASPAIDAGENLALLFDLLDLDGDGDTGERVPVDLDGRQRVFDAGGGPVVDLGAYAFGAPPVLPTAAEAPAEAPPDAPAVLAAFPNPFREHATVRYVLPRAGAVRVQVFDALGRAVATLAEGVRPAGVHEAPLDGAPLASGLYLVRVTAGGAAATQTLLRVR
ncbi:MAG: T9SS type A sorting domain-containing protein, partial [Rhodothermales bacterium]|nr:T9SS type A sorting domain-containing protein [Rhodothermales bacterium]